MLIRAAADAIMYTTQAITLLIIIRALLSFIPTIPRDHPIVRILDQVTSPILMPFQRLMPPIAGLDLSPILAILTLDIGSQLLARLILGLGGGF